MTGVQYSNAYHSNHLLLHILYFFLMARRLSLPLFGLLLLRWSWLAPQTELKLYKYDHKSLSHVHIWHPKWLGHSLREEVLGRFNATFSPYIWPICAPLGRLHKTSLRYSFALLYCKSIWHTFCRSFSLLAVRKNNRHIDK